jgi:hypothetical protein
MAVVVDVLGRLAASPARTNRRSRFNDKQIRMREEHPAADRIKDM